MQKNPKATAHFETQSKLISLVLIFKYKIQEIRSFLNIYFLLHLK